MQVFEAVAEYQYAILQLSEATQIWYLARLQRFGTWCLSAGIALEQIKPTTVARYLHELASILSPETLKPLSTYTVHGHARTIRTFLHWCAAEPQEYLSPKVPQHIAMPRTAKKIIETFTSVQIKAMFVAAQQKHFPGMAVRNKAILAVLLDTGIRASELCDLVLEHVHITPREGWIRVCGKGDKEREVGLGKRSRQYLYSYIKHVRKAPENELHVFLGHRSMPLTVNGLDQMLYRLRDAAHITGVRCSAHTFRHTFACNYLLQGGDLFMLSRLMGHTSVQVTEVYARTVKAEQARRHSKSVLDNL